MRKDEHAMSDEIPARPLPASSENRLRLLECIEQNVETLLGSIKLYARRMGLISEADGRNLAIDILQETVVEALAHADSFTATRQPTAWLLGIALNVIRRKKVEQRKRAYREILLGHLAEQQPQSASEQDVIDRLVSLSETTSDPGQALESDEEVVAMLSLVSPADQEVLRLGVLDELDRETLAQRLGIAPGTARMRLHRALRRLRAAWLRQQAGQKGERHE